MSDETEKRPETAEDMPKKAEAATPKSREKTRRMLIAYALIFALVVLALLLFSYFAQARENAELTNELQTETEKSMGVAQKYNSLLEEVALLRGERDELRAKADAYEKNYGALAPYAAELPEGENPGETLLAAAKRAETLERLSGLQRTYRAGTRAQCRERIAAMEEAGDAERMTEEEKTEYEYIKKKVNYSK